MVRKRIVVTGQVQGVFFRDACRRMAGRYGISGWVRNLPDGSVEAAFEGPADRVDQLVAWARNGPADAAVEGVEVHDEPPSGESGFTIRPTPRRH
jgi:acylphosphatase